MKLKVFTETCVKYTEIHEITENTVILQIESSIKRTKLHLFTVQMNKGHTDIQLHQYLPVKKDSVISIRKKIKFTMGLAKKYYIVYDSDENHQLKLESIMRFVQMFNLQIPVKLIPLSDLTRILNKIKSSTKKTTNISNPPTADHLRLHEYSNQDTDVYKDLVQDLDVSFANMYKRKVFSLVNDLSQIKIFTRKDALYCFLDCEVHYDTDTQKTKYVNEYAFVLCYSANDTLIPISSISVNCRQLENIMIQESTSRMKCQEFVDFIKPYLEEWKHYYNAEQVYFVGHSIDNDLYAIYDTSQKISDKSVIEQFSYIDTGKINWLPVWQFLRENDNQQSISLEALRKDLNIPTADVSILTADIFKGNPSGYKQHYAAFDSVCLLVLINLLLMKYYHRDSYNELRTTLYY